MIQRNAEHEPIVKGRRRGGWGRGRGTSPVPLSDACGRTYNCGSLLVKTVSDIAREGTNGGLLCTREAYERERFRNNGRVISPRKKNVRKPAVRRARSVHVFMCVRVCVRRRIKPNFLRW